MPFALGPFIATWWKAALGIVLGALLIYPVASCQGRKDGRAQVHLQLEKANTAFLQQKARADELAAQQRVIDAIAVNRQEQEMIDAVRQGTDSAPDDASRRLGCERLRRAGQDTSRVPACAGLGG